MALADEWDGPGRMSFTSRNSAYRFEVAPSSAKGPGNCQGQLVQTDKKDSKPVWSRGLVNDEAPIRAFVADTGNCVVTFDEWYHVGRFPVVVYDGRGRLVKVHDLDSLLSPRDRYEAPRTVTSIWWSRDSICFFGPEDKTFFVRLRWGTLLVIDLRDGKLMDGKSDEKQWKLLQDFAEKQVAELALEMVKSAPVSELAERSDKGAVHEARAESLPVDVNPRRTGAIVCGQLKLRKAIPSLRELLKDDVNVGQSRGDKMVRFYPVRHAAKEALDDMGEPVKDVVLEVLAGTVSRPANRPVQ